MSGEGDPVSDLDAAMAGLRRQSGAELVEATRAAASATVRPEPTVIPAPEFPYPLGHPLSGTVRYECSQGCGWYHDERPGAEPAGPIRLPVGFTDDDLSSAITAAAAARQMAYLARVEAAILDHYAAGHPGIPVPAPADRR